MEPATTASRPFATRERDTSPILRLMEWPLQVYHKLSCFRDGDKESAIARLPAALLTLFPHSLNASRVGL